MDASAPSAPSDGDANDLVARAGNDPLAFLSELSQRFAGSLDLEGTLHQALAGVARMVDAEAGAMFLVEGAEGALSCRACVGPVDVRGITVPKGQGIVGRAMEAGETQVVRDAYADPSFDKTVDRSSGFTTRSILCAPMMVSHKQVGAIEVLNKRGGDGRFDDADIRLLEVMSASAALAISNAQLAQALVEQERIRRELELAAEIQRNLLPGHGGAAHPIYGSNRPIREVSGDFFDYIMLEDGRFPFALGDVSGKGMNAALLMAKTVSLFRCLAKTVHDPGQLLGLINREIRDTATRGMFVTMVAGVFNPKDRVIRVANAGHEPTLLRADKDDYTSYPASSPPLGILADAVFPVDRVDLGLGTLYAFSDGVTEFPSKSGQMGLDGFKALLERHSGGSIKSQVDNLIASLIDTGLDARDDLTVLAVGELPSAADGGRPADD